MAELINGRTPEEIKLALELCNMISSRKNICESCPYNGECTPKDKPDQPGWDALLYIQRLEAAQPKWISVKERLPAKGLRVIVRDGHNMVTTGWRSYYVDVKGNELWEVDGAHNYRNDVTHWMPTPEPPVPKEER